jgi:hypothetical protein
MIGPPSFLRGLSTSDGRGEQRPERAKSRFFNVEFARIGGEGSRQLRQPSGI